MLLPYFYTLFYQVVTYITCMMIQSYCTCKLTDVAFLGDDDHQASQEGTPVVRPLWYEFPLDNETYPLSGQFMIGQSIMAAPVMIQEETESSVPIPIYFPPGTW